MRSYDRANCPNVAGVENPWKRIFYKIRTTTLTDILDSFQSVYNVIIIQNNIQANPPTEKRMSTFKVKAKMVVIKSTLIPPITNFFWALIEGFSHPLRLFAFN